MARVLFVLSVRENASNVAVVMRLMMLVAVGPAAVVLVLVLVVLELDLRFRSRDSIIRVLHVSHDDGGGG